MYWKGKECHFKRCYYIITFTLNIYTMFKNAKIYTAVQMAKIYTLFKMAKILILFKMAKIYTAVQITKIYTWFKMAKNYNTVQNSHFYIIPKDFHTVSNAKKTSKT